MPQPRTTRNGTDRLDDAGAYPTEAESAVLSEIDVLREALSILPTVAIEELI